MDIQTARNITEDTIRFGITHADYERNVEIARKSFIYMTGEGQKEEYLDDMREKETERQKRIREKASSPLTPLALNPVKTQFEKMFRVDGVIKTVEHKDKESNNKLVKANGSYHANKSMSFYFERYYLHYQFFDPNAWHITESRNVMNASNLLVERETYPLAISSKEAVNYHYDNGVPQWLIIKRPRLEEVRSVEGDDQSKLVHDFIFYGIGIALKYVEYDLLERPDGLEHLDLKVKGESEVKKFTVEVFENTGSTEFIGDKWGCYHDPESDGTVKVPPFWTGGRFVLDRLIRTASSFDVSVYNHIFPKLFQFDSQCKHTEMVGERETPCLGGYIGGDKNRVCRKCKGHGGTIHVTESDVIKFKLPANMEELAKLDLSKLAHYLRPPLDVTESIWNWLQAYKLWVYLASFNVSIIDQTGSSESTGEAKTAFEIDKIWDEINTRIYPCATHLSRLYEKAARVQAQYLEINPEGLTVRHSFPQDMKLEPLDVLITRYQKAKAAGLSYEVLWNIHCSILGKSFLDEPERVAEIKAWEYYRPFKSMQAEHIGLFINNRAPDDFDRVLYENWDKVQQKVYKGINDKLFSPLDKKRQMELIVEAVQEVTEETKTIEQTPDLGFPELLGIGDE